MLTPWAQGRTLSLSLSRSLSRSRYRPVSSIIPSEGVAVAVVRHTIVIRFFFFLTLKPRVE